MNAGLEHDLINCYHGDLADIFVAVQSEFQQPVLANIMLKYKNISTRIQLHRRRL